MATHDDDSLALGELLKRAREHRGLTLEQISKETKLPQRHLEALEHDNLAAVPGGFYCRAEIRAFARAVRLDPHLALRHLERALKPPVSGEPVPEISTTQKPMLSTTRMLIAIGVIAAVALLGRAMGGRESALASDDLIRSSGDSQSRSVPPVVETLQDALIGPSSGSPVNHKAQLRPANERLAEMELGARALAASRADVSASTDESGTGAIPHSISELVVTTEPPGARVSVDGIGWGTTPLTIRYLPPGDKLIRVTKEGSASEERLVRVEEGHSRTLGIQLRDLP